MTRPVNITTSDIDLAAALMTATGKPPILIFPGAEHVEFTFPSTEISVEVERKYSSSTLFQNVSRLTKNRAWICRQSRKVANTGGVAYAN